MNDIPKMFQFKHTLAPDVTGRHSVLDFRASVAPNKAILFSFSSADYCSR
jgi:hypothetical protein